MKKDASSEIISPFADGQKAALRYWAEASGRIEHYFKKHHACPMPNTLASQMLNVDASQITLASTDPVHYTRPIGTDNWEKIIFGATDEVFRAVMEEIEQYGSFMQGAALLDEGGQDAVRQAKYIIENIYRAHEEDGFNELIPSWHQALEKCQSVLRNHEDKTPFVNNYIRDADYLLEDMQLLEWHPFPLP